MKVGVLTAQTGVASSAYATVEQGVKARFALQNANGGVGGRPLEYVMGDTASASPSSITAAKKLIEVDGVRAILAVDSFFTATAPVTKKAGIPVLGANLDGGDAWTAPDPDNNLFDVFGYGNYHVLSTTWGEYFKGVGATNVAAVGYAGTVSSLLNATGVKMSAEHAGLKGYLNSSLAFGSTDVGPVVQAIKDSGADALYLPVVPSTGFAIAAGLRKAGVEMKSVVLVTGYGGDLLKSPEAVEAAQGYEFATQYAPVQLDTPATDEFVNALAEYADVTDVPTFGMYLGWVAADLYIYGVEQAGADASNADYISTLRGSTWDVAGLATPTDFSDIKETAGGLDQGNCINVTKLEGEEFVPQPDASPFCGAAVSGVVVE